MLYTSRPSSSHSYTRQKTEIAASSDNLQKWDENEHFEKCSGSSALGTGYDKPQRLGKPMYPYSTEPSFGFEKDSAMRTEDTVCSGFFSNLKTLDETMFGINISNDLHDQMPNETLFSVNISNDLHHQMPMSKNKAVAAVETVRHRIELKRGKYPQSRKAEQDDKEKDLTYKVSQLH